MNNLSIKNVRQLFRSRNLSLAIVCLQIGVALSCIGYASQTLRQKTEINRELLLELGASSYIATSVPLLLGITFLALAILVIWKPTAQVLWSIFGLIFLLTAIKFFSHSALYGLTFPSRAARYLAPLALLALLRWRASTNEEREAAFSLYSTVSAQRAALWLMRVGIALTFFGHGVKVLFHSANFIDLIEKSMVNLLGGAIFELETILFTLDLIAIVDLIVVALILFTRWQWVPLYMAAWTLLTATSRVTALGFAAWDEILIRGAYYTIPLAIYLLFRATEAHTLLIDSSSTMKVKTTAAASSSAIW